MVCVVQPSRSQPIDDSIDRSNGEIVVAVVIDQGARRGVTGTKALERHQRELSIARGFMRFDAEPTANMVDDGLVPAGLTCN